MRVIGRGRGQKLAGLPATDDGCPITTPSIEKTRTSLSERDGRGLILLL